MLAPALRSRAVTEPLAGAWAKVERADKQTRLLNREFQKTIVMVTHDPQAAEHASRILHLDKGRLVGDVVQPRIGAAS